MIPGINMILLLLSIYFIDSSNRHTFQVQLDYQTSLLRQQAEANDNLREQIVSLEAEYEKLQRTAKDQQTKKDAERQR